MNEFILNQIKKQNYQIEKSFNAFTSDEEENEQICINIILHLRTFVEQIITYHIGCIDSIEIRINKDNLRDVISKSKSPKYKVDCLIKLHSFLQASASHYVIDEISSIRLMNKYLPFLYEIRSWLKSTYSIDVLGNLQKFSMINIAGMENYYEKISSLVQNHPSSSFVDTYDRYYVLKSVPIVFDNHLFFESTLTIASDFASKFNRFLVYSNFRFKENYALKFNFAHSEIVVNDVKIPITIVIAFRISIRPCEFENYGKLLGYDFQVSTRLDEYKNLMHFLTINDFNLADLLKTDDDSYESIKKRILEKTKKPIIFSILDKARYAIRHRHFGSNALLYLSLKMNNVLIKKQYSTDPNYFGYFIANTPFDDLPFGMSLNGHNPLLSDLLQVFNADNKENQLFYRSIKTKTNKTGILYHSAADLHLDSTMADKYMISINKLLTWNPSNYVNKVGDFYYIKNFEDSAKFIIDKLLTFTTTCYPNYDIYAKNIISTKGYAIDSKEKSDIIQKIFSYSSFSCIFGPAGTGKTTMAFHLTQLFPNAKLHYIANTNAAVMNLYRRIGGPKDRFITINSYNKNNIESDILFIDECSMVSNEDMKTILNKNKFKFLVLLGDTYQIQSINYGTWFRFVKALINNNCVFELEELHRTSVPELINLWKFVREKQPFIDEILSENCYVCEIDSKTLFEENENQIILCLNYDGLYGINNINLIMQEKNNGKEFFVGNMKCKIGDPVLFTENNQFSNYLYNNLKGRIYDFDVYDDVIDIYLTVDTTITDFGFGDYSNFKLLEIMENNKSKICIRVEKKFDSDNDEQFSKLIPFQIAYAISIHKAQGLEYETVKIVINENSDELITHDIFYTAITRATKDLKIYWTGETQRRVLDRIIEKDDKKDIGIFARKFGFKIKSPF